jgi:hypothetical protein
MATLAELVELLQVHDEPQWALRLAGIAPGDITALRRLFPERDDAQDFHAVYLTSRGGRWLNNQDEVTVNERLSLLRAVLYVDARALMKGRYRHTCSTPRAAIRVDPDSQRGLAPANDSLAGQ